MSDFPLNKIPLFRSCDKSFFDSMQSHAQEQEFKKGKIFFIHGDEAERFYFIQNGWVKLFRETLDGAQAVVDILTSGHIFGETALFEDNIYPYSAEAVEPVRVISLPLNILQNEIENNNKMALAMLSSMARYRRQQDEEIEHRSMQNASQRIGCFLLRLAKQERGEAVTIHLPYDKTLVASRLGMQPETFSRALGKLKDQTGICVKGATIEIADLDDLISYTCSACSSEYPCKDISCA